MDLTVSQTDGKSQINIPESLDVTSAPQIQKVLNEAITAAGDIELDFSKTGLVTSAGLRVLLQAQKNVKAQGKNMTMKNISPDVLEVFNLTGLAKVFTIE